MELSFTPNVQFTKKGVSSVEKMKGFYVDSGSKGEGRVWSDCDLTSDLGKQEHCKLT